MKWTSSRVIHLTKGDDFEYFRDMTVYCFRRGWDFSVTFSEVGHAENVLADRELDKSYAKSEPGTHSHGTGANSDEPAG